MRSVTVHQPPAMAQDRPTTPSTKYPPLRSRKASTSTMSAAPAARDTMAQKRAHARHFFSPVCVAPVTCPLSSPATAL